MREIFKPEDFVGLYPGDPRDIASAFANEKLNKLIESWPVVYGTKDNNGQHFHENTNGNYNPTHTARLAFIEELPKEKCQHEPKRWQHVNDPDSFEPTCKHCGVELVAEWKEKK